jgi:hypothetical protein
MPKPLTIPLEALRNRPGAYQASFIEHDGAAPAHGNSRSTLLRIHCNYAENSEKFTERLDAFLIAPALSSPRISGEDHKKALLGEVKGQVFNA